MSERSALNVKEAAEFLDTTKGYIYQLVFAKRIPFYKPLGGKLFFRREELERFLFKKRQGGEDAS